MDSSDPSPSDSVAPSPPMHIVRMPEMVTSLPALMLLPYSRSSKLRSPLSDLV